MISFVYMWTNKVTGKKYIGSHIGRLDDGYIGSGKYFNNAVKSYGIENFFRTILFVLNGEHREEILDFEANLIQASMNRNHALYNLCVRGTGKYYKGFKRSKESCEKQSRNLTGVKQKRSRVLKRVDSNSGIFKAMHKFWYCTPHGSFITAVDASKHDPYSYRAILDLCKRNQKGYSLRKVK